MPIFIISYLFSYHINLVSKVKVEPPKQALRVLRKSIIYFNMNFCKYIF